MSNDPEARASGNSAVVIALVALVLIAGVAFMLFNQGNAPTDTTVVNNPAPAVTETTREVPVPVPGNTTIVTPPASSSSSTSTTTATTPSGGGSK